MYDYLVDNALKNIWCTPDQDLQSIVKPARVTPRNGVWNNVVVIRNSLKLPEQGVRFHVYQIGQLHPLLMGLFPISNIWETFADSCNRQSLIIDLYSVSGVQLPRTESWYMVTPDKNLIIAVKEQSLIPIDLMVEDLYLRVYSNAFFQSTRADAVNDFIKVVGGTVKNTDEILALQIQYNSFKALSGETYAFVNGLRVSVIDLFSVKPGDIAEFVYDSSIYKVVDFKLSTLSTFVSTLDSQHKYLLHYPGDDEKDIDYQDDVDFFIHKPLANNRFTGVYINKNTSNTVRMLTHKDYSLSAPHVLGIIQVHAGWSEESDLVVRVHIRKSGYLRPLVYENNRIKELYKLPEESISKAMLGLDALVPVWLADNLESSAYTQVMRSPILEVTKQLVQEAYGYNAISKLLANTPEFVKVESGRRVIDVPFGLYHTATAYEYDANGLLLGHYQHSYATTYVTNNPAAVLVEMINGDGQRNLNEWFNVPTIGLDPELDYRMYTCPIVNGYPSNKWIDVTGNSDYIVINGILTWLVDTVNVATMIRANGNFLAYKLNLKANDGLLNFNLTHNQRRNNVNSLWTMQVPMGELDLFLNGHSLIENLDYIVNFPEINIVNKRYLVNPLTDDQHIEIRFTGFCNKDLTRDVTKDVGFIQHGLLSNNNRFDIRDDKVLRIVVDGKLYDRSELLFSESDSGVTVPDVRNGRPYSIRDIVVSFNGLTIDNAYVLRKLSKVIDSEISDYMTLKIPSPSFTTPNVIVERYPVFSPFCCKLIYDLKANLFDTSLLTGFYSDNDVFSACKNYEYLLKTDPTQEGLVQDSNYVEVHPHNLNTVIDLDIYQYKFISRVVKLYLKDAVSLSHFIRIAT